MRYMLCACSVPAIATLNAPYICLVPAALKRGAQNRYFRGGKNRPRRAEARRTEQVLQRRGKPVLCPPLQRRDIKEKTCKSLLFHPCFVVATTGITLHQQST